MQLLMSFWFEVNCLYVKTGKSEIEIIEPKAHGVGFLYPPNNSPKGWDKDIPQWIYVRRDEAVRRRDDQGDEHTDEQQNRLSRWS